MTQKEKYEYVLKTVSTSDKDNPFYAKDFNMDISDFRSIVIEMKNRKHIKCYSNLDGSFRIYDITYNGRVYLEEASKIDLNKADGLASKILENPMVAGIVGAGASVLFSKFLK
ncbi:MAG: hypothetical protein WCR69_03455 [Sulfuricurvum sp.]